MDEQLRRTPVAPVDEPAARALFARFLQANPEIGDAELSAIEQFGDSREMADELAELVLAGVKTATASLLGEYDDPVEVPRAGTYWVMCGGDGAPLAVLATTEVRTGVIESVDDAFAWDEGEGDRTRGGWIAGHSEFWTRVTGGSWTTDDEVVFERFRVAIAT